MFGNEKGSRGTEIKKLSLKEALALNRIVVGEYKASGLENSDFALSVNTNASQRAHFRFDLNPLHIATALKAADIESNTMVKRAKPDIVGDCLGLTARVQALEEQLKRLTEFFIAKGFK